MDKKINVEDEDLVFPDDYYVYDREDYKSVIQGFSNQIKQAYKLGGDINFEGEINRIVISGMGGSAIAGDILTAYLHDSSKTPIIVNRGYKLPAHCDKNTLVIVSSYSGNTEETVSAYKDALRKSCKIVCITSGGKLLQMCESNRTSVIQVPKGIQPRAALAYSFFPMLRIMENIRIINNHKKEVEHLVKSMDRKIFMDTGITLSEKLVNTIPIIYSSETIWPVAYRWKTQFNENSKIMSYHNVFSELNHNEMAGIQNLQTKFHCIILRTDKCPHRMAKRMELTKKYYREKGIDVTDISLKGDTWIVKLFSAIYMGDWTSYFLALRYKTDPTPVIIIERFKKELGSYIS